MSQSSARETAGSSAGARTLPRAVEGTLSTSKPYHNIGVRVGSPLRPKIAQRLLVSDRIATKHTYSNSARA